MLLFYLGYLAFVAAPMIGLVWWQRHRRGLNRRAVLQLAILMVAALAACLPQLWVFAAVHWPNRGPQSGSVPLALVQTGTTVLIGTAHFPLGVLPLAALMAGAAALARLAIMRATPPALAPLYPALALGCALLALTGLGFKGRNALPLMLAALPLLAAALAALPRHARGAALALFALFQSVGFYNVAEHRGTAKRSFNTPYREVMATIRTMAADCPQAVVVHHDFVLTYLLPPALPQIGSLSPGGVDLRAGDCLIRVDGAATSLDRAAQAAWQASLGAAPVRIEGAVRFRPEPEAALAGQWLGHPVPDHAAIVTKLRVTGPAQIAPYWPE